MRFLFWVVIIFFCAAILAVLGVHNHNYVLLVLQNWRVQISLNWAIVLFVVLVVVLYALIAFLRGGLRLGERLGAWRTRRRQLRAYDAFKQAVNAFFEGKQKSAVKFSHEALKFEKQMTIAALIGARAAYATNDHEQYQWFIKKALNSKESRYAALMVQAGFALKEKQFVELEQALKMLKGEGYHNGQIMRMKLDACICKKEWQQAGDLVEHMYKENLLNSQDTLNYQLRIYPEMMLDLSKQPESLSEFWKKIAKNKTLLDSVPFLVRTMSIFRQVGLGYLLQTTLAKQLDKQWSSQLASVYWMSCQTEEQISNGIQQAERWLVNQSQDANLLYTLGQLCILSQVWGKAESYLSKALELQNNNPNFLFAMAKLMDKMGNSDKALTYYRQAAVTRNRLAISFEKSKIPVAKIETKQTSA